MHVASLNAGSELTLDHVLLDCRQLFQLNIYRQRVRRDFSAGREGSNEVKYLSEFHPSETNYICQTPKVRKIMYSFQCFIM